MNLGDRIRNLRDQCELTQGQLALSSSVSQGYLSQLENGEVKNPSAAVLLRVAQAVKVDPDELFEAAGYPTVRTLRATYERYESTIDDENGCALACEENRGGTTVANRVAGGLSAAHDDRHFVLEARAHVEGNPSTPSSS